MSHTGVQFPAEARMGYFSFRTRFQTGSGANSAFYPRVKGVSYTEGKVAEA
jgi:hypothetical protein